ncbi:hypothetical protein D3C72_939530 [compost metagenome]
MLCPAAKAPLPAMQSWRAVGGQHGRFNQQGAGTAHWVDHRRARQPARAHHNGRSQVFFDRRNTGAIAVTALVQAFAAEIQRNIGGLFIEPHVDAQIGIFTIDVRAFKIFTREAVDDGVFHLQCTVLAVTDFVVQTAEMHGKGRTRGENLCPVDRLHAEIQIKVAVDLAGTQRQHDARRQATPHQALVNKPCVALKVDTTLNHLTLKRAKAFQFSF